MKRLGAKKVLGVAMGQQSLLLAEVHTDSGRRRLVRAAEFRFPETVGLDQPAALGQALAALLKKEGFATRDAVIGLPAKWLATRRKDLPPATSAVAAGSLRLQAEGEFASEMKDLVIDFAGQPSPTAASVVLLAATSRDSVEQCQALAKAAGLRVRQITASAAALARVTGPASAASTMLLATSAVGGELIALQAGNPLQLRHLSPPDGTDESAGSLAGEIRRMLAGLPAGRQTDHLTLWDGLALPTGFATALSKRLEMPVDRENAASLVQTDLPGADRFVPAIAVALAAMESAATEIDFLDSRLAPPPPPTNRRPLVWAAVVGAAIVVAVCVGLLDIYGQQAELASLNTKLTEVADSVHQAETAAARLATARASFGGKPRFTACLGELTNLLPDEGSIWATGITQRADMSGQISGKATSEQQILSLLDRMKDSKRFTDSKLLDMRDAGKTGREVSFSISFVFRPVE